MSNLGESEIVVLPAVNEKIIEIVFPSLEKEKSNESSESIELAVVNDTLESTQISQPVSFSSSGSSSKSSSKSEPTSVPFEESVQKSKQTIIIYSNNDITSEIESQNSIVKSSINGWYEVEIESNDYEKMASKYTVWENHLYESVSVTNENQSKISQLSKNISINATIAIVDTGISSFEILNEESFVQGEDSFDYNGHGTGIASVIQSVTNASLLNAKALNRFGQGTTFTLLSSIYWAVAEGADVISLSVGSPTTQTDEPLQEAIDYAISHNVIVVVAAGNCGKGCTNFTGVTSPGSLDSVITVGAVNDRYEVAPFSGYKKTPDLQKPDVVAPGVGIEVITPDGSSKVVSGTSIATPYVSAVAEKNYFSYIISRSIFCCECKSNLSNG